MNKEQENQMQSAWKDTRSTFINYVNEGFGRGGAVVAGVVGGVVVGGVKEEETQQAQHNISDKAKAWAKNIGFALGFGIPTLTGGVCMKVILDNAGNSDHSSVLSAPKKLILVQNGIVKMNKIIISCLKRFKMPKEAEP